MLCRDNHFSVFSASVVLSFPALLEPHFFFPLLLHVRIQMPGSSRQEIHDRVHIRSYKNLQNARLAAQRKPAGYDSVQTREDLGRLFHARFGQQPHDWQVDVTEAMLLGLDCTVIAGTGAGKTMPFMMPLLLDHSRMIIIISPLKTLQSDQVSNIYIYLPITYSYHVKVPRFEVMGIPAAAVNGDTWDGQLEKVCLAVVQYITFSTLR